MSIFFTKVREAVGHINMPVFLRRKWRNFPIFDEIPRVWRFFKMATMSVFLEEP